MTQTNHGRAFVFGDGIDTDVLAPGLYMKYPIATIAQHCLETIDPDFVKSLAQVNQAVLFRGDHVVCVCF